MHFLMILLVALASSCWAHAQTLSSVSDSTGKEHVKVHALKRSDYRSPKRQAEKVARKKSRGQLASSTPDEQKRTRKKGTKLSFSPLPLLNLYTQPGQIF